jgi:hypothetical protein
MLWPYRGIAILEYVYVYCKIIKHYFKNDLKYKHSATTVLEIMLYLYVHVYHW